MGYEVEFVRPRVGMGRCEAAGSHDADGHGGAGELGYGEGGEVGCYYGSFCMVCQSFLSLIGVGAVLPRPFAPAASVLKSNFQSESSERMSSF